MLFLIFAVGMVFRLVYTQSTDWYIRQHDVYGSMGHYEYIMSLFDGKGLPENIQWQYYQPPMWHILCAVWLKIQDFFGISMKYAVENLQMLSFLCSSLIMLLSHKLFKMFKLDGVPLCIACGIIAFHPTFIILSASINNDVLSITLALLAIVLALKWYREPNFKNIIFLALAIGFSMAVKLSGGLIALGVAILFAIRLFGKQYKKKGILIGQFASFGAICFPLALWWQFRNLILFDIPITYIPMLSEKSSQYIGFRTEGERLFDMSSIFDAGVYPARVIKNMDFEYFEYNIPAAALKTSVFGEYYIGMNSPVLEFFANLLFWTAALLAIASIIGAIYTVVKAVIAFKNKIETEHPISEIVFPLVCAVTLLISYIKFCFDYAFFCTMDFRYIALTVVFGALYLGLMLKDRQKNNKMFDKVLLWSMAGLTILMSVSSMSLYASIA